jgi:hypothetical protein
MTFYAKTAALAAAVALTAAPAFAGAPSGNPGATHKLAAPGRYCKSEPKTHVAGQSATPFSLCVKAQAKLRSGSTKSPRTACKGESKKRLDGQHGSPFSLCVSAGAKVLKDRQG